MPSYEDNHREEKAALDSERIAFQRFQSALSAVNRQCFPLGNGTPTDESFVEFESAKAAWHSARAEIDRIVEEIHTGKRR